MTDPAGSPPTDGARAGTPARLDAFLMLPMKLMFAATVAAVSGEPSEQVTPLRMV